MSNQYLTYTDYSCAHPGFVQYGSTSGWTGMVPTFESIKLSEPLKEGIEMKNLYEVCAVYGEDRLNPVVKNYGPVIAENDEDAKIKSGVYSFIKPEWDADYLTILVRNLGAVKIKEKAKEVKNV